MSHISLLALEKIKREAKKLKKQFPDLPHGQRLDMASRENLKVRNYHEAKIQCKKHINAQVSEKGGLAECSYCQLSFVVTEKDDLKSHELMHLEYEKAENVLGFLPASYNVREKEKKKAHEELRSNGSFSTKMAGALRLIRAHFDRSLERAIYGEYWREHPTFDEYLAKINCYDKTIPVEVMTEIRNKYGKDRDQLDKGTSNWSPPKLENKAIQKK